MQGSQEPYPRIFSPEGSWSTSQSPTWQLPTPLSGSRWNGTPRMPLYLFPRTTDAVCCPRCTTPYLYRTSPITSGKAFQGFSITRWQFFHGPDSPPLSLLQVKSSLPNMSPRPTGLFPFLPLSIPPLQAGANPPNPTSTMDLVSSCSLC